MAIIVSTREDELRRQLEVCGRKQHLGKQTIPSEREIDVGRRTALVEVNLLYVNLRHRGAPQRVMDRALDVRNCRYRHSLRQARRKLPAPRPSNPACARLE